jgi:hypothetical protein
MMSIFLVEQNARQVLMADAKVSRRFLGGRAMRPFILLTVLAASPAYAAALRCTPTENCINDQCTQITDPDSAFLLINAAGPAPILRSGGVDTRMTEMSDGAQTKWQGVQTLAQGQISISLTLALRESDMTYSLSQYGDFGAGVSTGQCEAR